MSLYIANTIWKKSSLALLWSIAAMFVALAPSTLYGQSVDYGALEQLFNEPVTTSVTGSPQRVSDVPATIEIVTAEDIRRSGAKDIPGVLRHVAGVDTLEWGNDNIDVSIRGYDQASSSRLLVLVNGRQVYADDFGYTPWSAIPIELSAIRQIEVIKGPSSALFGFNAVGGVINIITYDPLFDHVNTVSITGGTQNLVTASAVTTPKLGERVSVMLSAGGSMDDDFSTATPRSEVLVSRRPEDRAAVNLHGVIRLKEKMLLDFEASHSVAQLNEMAPDYQLMNDRRGTSSVRGQFTAEGRRFGLLQASAYTNWLKTTFTPGIVNQDLHLNSRLTVVEAHDIYKLGEYHTLRGAVEYRQNTEGTTPLAGANISYRNFAVSGMWDWKITPTLSLTNAFRVDRLAFGRNGYLPPNYPFSNSDWHGIPSEYSYNSALVWKPGKRDDVRLMISRGTQLPNLVESGALMLVSPFLNFSGKPTLAPTDTTNYEIGWDRAIPASHIMLRASAFHQHNYDLMAFSGGLVATPGGLFVEPDNIGSSDANGIEIGLRSPPHQKFRWSVDYRLERLVDDFLPEDRNGDAEADYEDTTPRHQVKANLGWANSKWELDSYYQFESNNHGLQPGGIGTILVPVPQHLSVDARAAYNLTDWITWSVAGQNLTHASQVQTSGPAVERRVLGTISFNF
jgi:outer membrane receptor for ferrienterochelin and colicins